MKVKKKKKIINIRSIINRVMYKSRQHKYKYNPFCILANKL